MKQTLKGTYKFAPRRMYGSASDTNLTAIAFDPRKFKSQSIYDVHTWEGSGSGGRTCGRLEGAKPHVDVDTEN